MNKSFLSLSLLASLACSDSAFACVADNSGSAKVSEVYPTANELPENLLRFYIYFSEPMSRQGILSSISLIDENGKKSPGVFLENRYDLWSADAKRLTLLFDPGRVKKGLIAHNRLGRALIPDKSYSLQIKDATDDKGCTLSETFIKSFTVIKADHTPPNIDDWQLNSPTSGTKQPLDIDLNRIVDHLSLAYRIRVQTVDGAAIAGALELAEHERIWRFTPTQAWLNTDYQIAIDTTLEDVAGNRLSQLFDRPTSKGEIKPPPEKLFIPFTLN